MTVERRQDALAQALEDNAGLIDTRYDRRLAEQMFDAGFAAAESRADRYEKALRELDAAVEDELVWTSGATERVQKIRTDREGRERLLAVRAAVRQALEGDQ